MHGNRGQQVCPPPQKDSLLNSTKSTASFDCGGLTLETVCLNRNDRHDVEECLEYALYYMDRDK